MIQLHIPQGAAASRSGAVALFILLAGLDLTILGAIVAVGMLLGQ